MTTGATTGGFLRKRDALLLALGAVLVGWLYAVFLGRDPTEARYAAHQYFPWQAEAWLQGRLDLARPVPAEFLALPDPYDPAANERFRFGGEGGIHDLSFYRGKLYLYWGPTPTLVAFLPWRALTGSNLSTAWAGWSFALVTWLASALLLTRAVRHHFPATPSAVVALCLAGVAGSNWTLVTITRANVWETPIFAACCFGAITWWLLAETFWARPEIRWRWLALASLTWGLAIGARPIWIVGSPVLLLPLWRERTQRREPRFRTLLLAAILPVGVCVAALLAHNFARFGSILEFGQHWQLASNRQVESKLFALGNLAYNAKQYLLSVPQPARYFPFVLPPLAGEPPTGYLGLENTYGLLVVLPFLWFAVRLLRSRGYSAVLLPPLLSLAALFAILVLFSGAASRYELELATPLAVLAALGVLPMCESRPSRRHGLQLALIGTAVAVSLCGSVLVASRMANGYADAERHPALARGANRVATAIGWSPADGHDAVEMTVQFPAHATITSAEPQALVMSGAYPLVDCVFVDYPDADHVRFLYHHRSVLAMSEPVALARGTPVALRIELGGTLPPPTHPFWGATSTTEIAQRRFRMSVSCDGTVVLAGFLSDSLPTQAVPHLGSILRSEGPAYRFTGTISDVRFFRRAAP